MAAGALLAFSTSHSDGQQPTPGWRLLFSNADDITDPVGRLAFRATPLQPLGKTNLVGEPVYSSPRADGAWDVYAVQFTRDTVHDRYHWENSWKLVRSGTRDGLHYDPPETVFESPVAPWTENFAMAWNPDAREYLLLNLKVDGGGFGYTAFFSPDGRQWKAWEGNPLFYEGDAMSLFWSPALRRFVCASKSLQPYPKRYLDHGGITPSLHNNALRDRRVLMLRSSSDGRHWEPEANLEDVWNRSDRKAAVPDKYLIVPDADDPLEMEFYSGFGFWYYDRSYLLMLNYAASPLLPNTHGPQLDLEWWLSRDGWRWDRPYRDVSAEPFRPATRLECNPMFIDGNIAFPVGNQLLGMKQDRISYVSARANGEFSTRPFIMPSGDLRLNAACPSPERAYAVDQAYVMADVLDEQGKVIPGFEADKSLLRTGNSIDLPLLWNNVSTRELAGRKVRLRFHFRSANIYAVSVSPATAK